MCIIFPLHTKTHLPFRKFSTSSEVPQNPNVIVYCTSPMSRLVVNSYVVLVYSVAIQYVVCSSQCKLLVPGFPIIFVQTLGSVALVRLHNRRHFTVIYSTTVENA